MLTKLLFDPFYGVQFYLYFFRKKNKIVKLWARKKLIRKYDIHLGLNTIIGNNVIFPHPSSIIIGEGVSISKNCVIYQGVTIGKGRNEGYPLIKENVTIYPNTTIIGNIEIGSDCKIGANSLVLKSIPKNCVCYGNPAKYYRDGEK